MPRFFVALALTFVFLAAPAFNPGVVAAQSSASHTVGLRIIVVDSADEAARILELLKQGADFATIAKKNRWTPTPAMAVTWARLIQNSRPELRDGLRGLAPGQISAVIAILRLRNPPGSVAVESSVQSLAGRVCHGTRQCAASFRHRRDPLQPFVGGKGEAPISPSAACRNPMAGTRICKQCAKYAKTRWPLSSINLSRSLRIRMRMIPPHRKMPSTSLRRATPRKFIFVPGRIAKAVEQWEAAYALAADQMPPAMAELEEALAIAYLHKAEMENDVYTEPEIRCIFPPLPALATTNTESIEKSIQYSLKYLARRPDFLDAKWILNLDYMALGQYPGGVPKNDLIPRGAFESPESVGRFVDVAAEAGINLFSDSGGLIVDDFENNGLLDIVTSDYYECAPMHYFHNNGDGAFSDHTAQSGLRESTGRPQLDSGRLQQRRLPRYSGPARRLGISAA